jgi:hypothetical protein
MNMLKRIRNYIENEPWEHHLERENALIERFCWSVLVLSALYFGTIMVRVAMGVQ